MHAGAAHGEPLQREPPLSGQLDAAPAGEEIAGERAGLGGHLVRRPLGDHATAVLAGARPHVDDVVGQAHGLLVMLDDQHGVAQVAQPHQGLDQPQVVALVQTDARLVEDVEHADERRADLRGEADALRLAARERRRGALQREVAHPDVVQEAQPLRDLPDDAVADEALRLAQRQPAEEAERLAHAEERELVDVEPADGDGEAGRLEPRPVALRARPVGHVLLDLLAHLLGLGLGEAPLQMLDDPREARAVVPHAPAVVAVAERDALLAGPVQEEVAVGLRQVVPGHAGVHRERPGDALEDLLEPAEGEVSVGQERALVDAERTVGHDEAGVDLLREPEPVTGRAGAVRAVEAEDAGLDLGQRDAAVDAGELLTEREPARRVAGDLDVDEPVGQRGGRLDGVGEPPPQPVLHHEAVDDHADVVLELLVEVDVLLELTHDAVDLDPCEAVGAQLLEQLPVFALAAAYDGRQNLDTALLGQRHHLVDDLLRHNLTFVYVSLHGARASLHDAMVRTKAFEQTLRGIHQVAGRVQELTVNTVVTRDNLFELRQIVELLEPLPNIGVKFTFPQPKGAAFEHFDAVIPSLSEAAHYVADAISSAQARGSPVRFGFEGFPLCLMPRLESLHDDLLTRNIRSMMEPEDEDLFPVDDLLFTKLPQCENCENRAACPGVYREYIRRRGDEEIVGDAHAATSHIVVEQAHLREQAAHERRHWVRLSWACNNRCRFCLDRELSRASHRSEQDIGNDILQGRREGELVR